eukprot:3873332-Amphidinium_carterae.1
MASSDQLENADLDKWVHLFFYHDAVVLTRTFLLDVFVGATLPITIVTDASPWGLGGYDLERNRLMAYFSTVITADDEQVLQCAIGDCSSQQAFEALAF